MEDNLSKENARAERISFRINEYHSLLNNIYENAVDRDLKSLEKDIKFLTMELRFLLKSLQDEEI